MRRKIVRFLVLAILVFQSPPMAAEEPEDADTAVALKILAKLARQGDFSNEKELAERLVEGLYREFGREHPITLKLMATMAARLYEQGAYTEARRLYEQGVEASQKVWGAEHPNTLSFMGNLASTLEAQGDLSRARELKQQVLENRLRVQGPEHPDTLTAMNNLSQTLRAQGDVEAARQLQEKVLPIQRRVLGPKHPNTLTAMSNLAQILHAQGELARAKELDEEVLSIRRRMLGSEHSDTLMAMNNLAGTLYEQGDLAGARKLQDTVLSVRRRVLGPEHPDTLTAMSNLAQTLRAQGDFAGARELQEEALSVRRRVLGSEHPHTVTAMNGLARILKAQGDLAAARQLEGEALAVHRRVLGPKHPDTLMAMNNLAGTFQAQGDLAGARELQEEVVSVCRRVLGPEHPNTLRAMNSLAGILYGQGHLEGARQIYEDIVEIRARLYGPDHQPNTTEEADTFHLLGHIHRDSHKLEEARRYYFLALDALEAQAERVDLSEDVKSLFRAQFGAAYREAIAASLALELPGEALHTLERFRAQSLVTLFAHRRLAASQIPPELEATRHRISARYDAIYQELDRLEPESDEEKITALRKEQAELRRQREVTLAKIKASLRTERKHPKSLTLDAIRHTLDPGTLMLSYSVGEEGTDLFILSREGKLEVHQLSIVEETLWQQLLTFVRQFQGNDRSKASEARARLGQWLYEKLMHPAAKRIEASERLLILPDGPLHYLPFAALVRETEASGRGWQYLVEWKPLHTALAATVYAELRKWRPAQEADEGRRPLELVAFGDPAYPGDGSDDRANNAPITVRYAVSRGLFDALGPLPHTGREVTEIRRLFPEDAARTYLREAATEERVKSEASKARIVHFAVHGVLDPLTPMDSFLALSIPETIAKGQDNGLLQAWEIFEGMHLDADLVVLSACTTALGPQRGGEGIISLSRAFQVAGARTVMASLWRVSDESTAELMIRFYRHLGSGKSKDEALRSAQLELIRGPIEVVTEDGERVERDFTAPYHWAAFQLIGDWQ